MSIPNPYGQSSDPHAGPNPYAQQPPQASQAPGTNPYQQAPGAVSPHPYAAQPSQPGGYPPPPGGPGAPPPGTRRSAPSWLWALGGVVVASAVWGGLLLTGTVGSGSGSGDADFAGNAFQKNLCSTVELKAIQKRYALKTSDDGETRFASRQPGLDRSHCGRPVEDRKPGGGSTSTYIHTTAEWHKKTDPKGEFESRQRGYEDQSEDTYAYETEEVGGIGDEAYLIAERRGDDKDTLGGMTLAVREGHFTFEMRWSWFAGSSENRADPPSEEAVEKMLRADVKSALAAMKQG
ncbi:hypothetical protein DY218_20660 [Streptomyces triticagri]|uniref:DUF3558 domain-containing protein n=1 Tax=Streptomyces triticagri TaxID=2293568 RepID=A0A372M1I1_9ACTN|nr:hypothetical protein [Streptomyces triticagri]RFU84806.1 hypothetical protein DY218_20660 [Streptomyces triticagri]